MSSDAMHELVQVCQDQQTEFSLLRESLVVSRINHTLRVHGRTVLEEPSAAAVYDEIGKRSLERLFPGLTEDSMTHATLSEPIRNRVQECARHRWSCTPGSSPQEMRLSEVIDTATSTYLGALDNDEQATARLFIQKASQAADESWQNTVSGQQGPGVAGLTIAPLETPPLRLSG